MVNQELQSNKNTIEVVGKQKHSQAQNITPLQHDREQVNFNF